MSESHPSLLTSTAGHGKYCAGAEQPTALLTGPHSVKPVCLVPSCIAVQTGFQSGLAGLALCLALCQNGGGQMSGLFLGFCRFQSWHPIPRRASMTGSAISPIAISIVFPASPAFPVPDTVRTTSSVLDVSRPAGPPSRASSPHETIDRRRPDAIRAVHVLHCVSQKETKPCLPCDCLPRSKSACPPWPGPLAGPRASRRA